MEADSHSSITVFHNTSKAQFQVRSSWGRTNSFPGEKNQLSIPWPQSCPIETISNLLPRSLCGHW